MAKKSMRVEEAEKREIPPEISLGLPKKDLYRVDEVARYFSVTERTIRLWIEHGHLESEKIVGVIRITKESINRCRFKVNREMA